MNPIAAKVLFAVVALSLVGWWAYDKFQDSKVEKQRVEQQEQSRDAVVAASKRYGAIIDWEERLKDSSFSIQIEDAIMPEDGKPIVVEGFVEDVARHNDQYYLYINNWRTGGNTISFVLECDPATARHVIEKNDSFGSVSVIAQITSVEKAQLALRSGVKTTEDPAPIEIDSSSLFIARGKCLEVVSSDN
jgi:hypothetical protein